MHRPPIVFTGDVKDRGIDPEQERRLAVNRIDIGLASVNHLGCHNRVGRFIIDRLWMEQCGKANRCREKDDPKHGKMKWIVSENGAVRGWNEKNAIEITLTPSLQGGKVSWNCKGYPVDAMPSSCGGKG